MIAKRRMPSATPVETIRLQSQAAMIMRSHIACSRSSHRQEERPCANRDWPTVSTGVALACAFGDHRSGHR